MWRNISNMDDLVNALTGLKEILIMGNSEHINKLDPKKIKDIVSIGVCRIGLKYHPDVLLWTENVNWTGRGDKEAYRKILIDTKSPVKICREHWEALKVPEDPRYSFFQFGVVEGFSHEWKGGLKYAPSVPTAIHLAMVCKIKNIYIAGVDYANNKYFWGGTQFGSENGEYKINDVRAVRQYYDMIEEANTKCKIWMCSMESKINNFDFTSRFNK